MAERSINSFANPTALAAGVSGIALARTWHRRDVLLAMFWPELDTSHARTALRNALYVLRQTLGEGVVVTRGDEEVSIDPTRLTTDLDALLSAIRDKRADDALALYHGDLLPGLYPGDSEGFVSWLQTQRAKGSHGVARVAGVHAERLERASRWRRTRSGQARPRDCPEDETAVRRVLRLHEATGDRAGGWVYEKFAAWLSRLRREPAPETSTIANRLREPNGATAAVPRRVTSPDLSAHDRALIARKRPTGPFILLAGVLLSQPSSGTTSRHAEAR